MRILLFKLMHGDRHAFKRFLCFSLFLSFDYFTVARLINRNWTLFQLLTEAKPWLFICIVFMYLISLDYIPVFNVQCAMYRNQWMRRPKIFDMNPTNGWSSFFSSSSVFTSFRSYLSLVWKLVFLENIYSELICLFSQMDWLACNRAYVRCYNTFLQVAAEMTMYTA